ncbi:MAG: aldehyde dehydrogenase family protein, partial [Jannaschia sp.]
LQIAHAQQEGVIMGPQDATDLKERLFIDGTWRVPVEGGTLPVIDPATEEVFHQVPEATSADVDIAVEAAQRAFADWCNRRK